MNGRRWVCVDPNQQRVVDEAVVPEEHDVVPDLPQQLRPDLAPNAKLAWPAMRAVCAVCGACARCVIVCGCVFACGSVCASVHVCSRVRFVCNGND